MADRAVPGLPWLGRETPEHHLRRLRQMAASLPRPETLPALRASPPRQRRRAVSRVFAAAATRRPRLDLSSGTGPTGPARPPSTWDPTTEGRPTASPRPARAPKHRTGALAAR